MEIKETVFELAISFYKLIENGHINSVNNTFNVLINLFTSNLMNLFVLSLKTLDVKNKYGNEINSRLPTANQITELEDNYNINIVNGIIDDNKLKIER